MKRSLSDSEERQRKKLKSVISLQLSYADDFDCESSGLLEIIHKELPCAHHLRIFARVSSLEIKWDVDRVIGEDHRNSIFIRDVPLRTMRGNPPLLEAVIAAAKNATDLFLIDEFNGFGNSKAIQYLAQNNHWVSLERLSLWYLRDVYNGARFPTHSFPTLPHLRHFALCGISLLDASLNELIGQFPALQVLALHNRTLKKKDENTAVGADIATIFGNNQAQKLRSLTISGVSWSDMDFCSKFLTDRTSLDILEFDASDMSAEEFSKLLRTVSSSSVTEMRIYDMKRETMPRILANALKQADYKLEKLKVIQPNFSRLSRASEQELTDSLEVNTSLKSFLIPHYQHRDLLLLREYYLKLNRLGREHVYKSDLSGALWPHILKQARDDASVINWLLREKPELIQRHPTLGV